MHLPLPVRTPADPAVPLSRCILVKLCVLGRVFMLMQLSNGSTNCCAMSSTFNCWKVRELYRILPCTFRYLLLWCACTEADSPSAPLSLLLFLSYTFSLSLYFIPSFAVHRLACTARRHCRPLSSARESQSNVSNWEIAAQWEKKREGESEKYKWDAIERDRLMLLQLSTNTACACGFTMFASLECIRLLGELSSGCRMQDVARCGWCTESQLPVGSSLCRVACIYKCAQSVLCARPGRETGHKDHETREERSE